MTYPTEYQPTLKDPIPYYGPSNPALDSVCVLYGSSIGISYIGPYLEFPETFRTGSNPTNLLLWGMTQSPEIQRMANILKQLPAGLRGGRPLFVEQYDVNYFIDDKLTDASVTSLTNFRGVTTVTKNFKNRTNLSYTQFSGYNGTPWPSQGVSVMGSFMKDYFNELSKAGATVDFLMTDTEAVRFGELNSTLLSTFLGNSKYYNTHGGVSSWNDILIYLGSTATGMQTTNMSNYTKQAYLYDTKNWAWFKVAQKYVGENVRLGYANPAQEVFPKIVTSNYYYFEGEQNRSDEAVAPDGQVWPQGGYVGNAGSPVLYGRARQLDVFTSYGNCVSKEEPSYIWPWLLERRQLYKKGPGLVLSASLSFMLAMMELRTAKRNAPNQPLAPWINSIYTYGYSTEGHFKSNVFTIGINQSPAEVLHDHWYPINIVGSLYDVGGITSYNGSTNAYLIKTSIPLISETWYKQNIASITFDGATTAYQIRTLGTTGSTAALAYYLSRSLTAGHSYIFSYYIDMDRGFTGLNARFTLWNTTDSIGLAPSLTTTSGITFEQILPVSGSKVYRESPIEYTSGDSGWTKVAWRFLAPSSSPKIGLHIYHAGNNVSGGYTAFIKDVYLNYELSGKTEALNPIDNTKNKKYSLEYYYNGLTEGLTYTFSYYIDVSKSYTGYLSLQTINHFQPPTYSDFFPIGITFNQILPATVNSNFNTAGISYGSATGWTKFAYSFNIPIGTTLDRINRPTFAASILKSEASILDSNETLIGNCFYIASPSLEVENSGVTTSIPVAPVNYESITRWNYGPPIGWIDAQVGPNRRYNVYYYERGGNSAYFGELIRHCCLSGTAKFGLFNPSDYVNFGLTGSIRDLVIDGDDVTGKKFNIYAASGLTQHVTSFLTLDSILKEVHQKIGGFTTSSADVSRPNWLAPYIASGAPDTRGITWWWRVTAMPGYTVYCNGITLSSRANVGTWVGTNGPTLAGIPITSTKWTGAEAPVEPSIPSPVKEVNFAGMTSLSSLLAAGFTFSRGGTATYIDSTGKVAYAGPNQPRFTYDEDTLEPLGLMLETSHTNLLNWSESFASTGGSQNNWIDTNISRSTGSTAPSGLTYAIRFTATTANGSIISSATVGNTAFKTFSVYIRGITGNESVFYTLNGGTSWIPINGITQNYFGYYGMTFTIKQPPTTVSTMWKRYIFNPSSDNHKVGIRLGNTSDSVELWGAQLETINSTGYTQRRYAQSYVPTTGTTAAASTESCSITGTSFSSWYGLTYGSFVIEARNVFGNGTALFTLEQDAANNFGLYPNGYYMYVNSRIASKSVSFYSSPLVTTTEFCADTDYKFVFTYGPYGMKYSSYFGTDIPGYHYIRTTNWSGNTIGAPKAIQFKFASSNNMLTIKKLRYWPFVFDENTMKQMGKGNYDPSNGLFGAWG